MKTFLRNSLGFGLMESMLSIGLLGVGAYFMVNGYDLISGSKDSVDQSILEENTLANLTESIRVGITSEKIDFRAEEEFLSKTTVEGVRESLVSCWTRTGITSIKNIPSCPGRIGYVVTPLKTGNITLRGLFMITIRMTHDELFPGEFRQFQFIVRGP
ncbi:MAG: hypothetical protein ACLGG7_00815 [Bacteriovoracia bacterium]